MTKKIKIKESVLKKISTLAVEFVIDAYVVGGYVRDSLLGRPRKDIDITVVGDSLEFARFVAERLKSHAVVFERFRTAMVPYRGWQLEFVGTRKEEYTKNSRKPVVSVGSLDDDLRRRDFTVNAMAASLDPSRYGEIVDMFDGIGDLSKRLLRTPLEPSITYSDDPLRMMRAARFASQLEFDLDPSSILAISQMAERIKIISQERVSDEFFKILLSPKPSIGLKILFETGVLAYVFPEISNLAGVEIKTEGNKTVGHKDVFFHSLKVLDNISQNTNNLWLRQNAGATIRAGLFMVMKSSVRG